MKSPWRIPRGTPDMASCMEVGRVMHRYLDRELDEHTAKRVARHLEECRRCGLEAAAYTEIKHALGRRTSTVDAAALDRLRAFSDSLASGHALPDADTGVGDG
ncbi:MAG: zf-HC2 domain-containing protein [Actinobacteria bacterium]|nr:zf-HC2 domain-containing protein [Actinomycetota bacterium]